MYAPVGFSWSVLILGAIVPLFRLDLKWCVLMYLINIGVVIIMAFDVSFEIFGFLIINMIFGFIYNKLYIRDLLAQGFVVQHISSGELERAAKWLGRELPVLE